MDQKVTSNSTHERSDGVISSPQGLDFHPKYFDLLQETHARTAQGVPSPSLCTHLVFLSNETDAAADRAATENLLKQDGFVAEQMERTHARIRTPHGLLHWNRHTEFSSFTLFDQNATDDDGGPIPDERLREIIPGKIDLRFAGRLLLAIRVHVEEEKSPLWWKDWDTRENHEPSGCLSLVNGGKSLVWYNFMPHADEFLHIYVRDRSGYDRVRGRVVQRLLDIETYRILALLALPEVKRIGPMIAKFDAEIANIAGDLALDRTESDEALLHRLTHLAAQVEDLSMQIQFRLNASLAYSQIVRNRLSDLREQKVEGYQRISNFILRRLDPAMRTVEAISERQRSVSQRISRLSDLLRARVDIALEKQNQAVLQSMDKRVDQQLTLQKTVEGLSVIAISYYAIGIFLYFFKPLKDITGWGSADFVMLAIVPLVLICVGIGVSRVRGPTK